MYVFHTAHNSLCVWFNTDLFLVESSVYSAPAEPFGSAQSAAEPLHMGHPEPANRQSLRT